MWRPFYGTGAKQLAKQLSHGGASSDSYERLAVTRVHLFGVLTLRTQCVAILIIPGARIGTEQGIIVTMHHGGDDDDDNDDDSPRFALDQTQKKCAHYVL